MTDPPAYIARRGSKNDVLIVCQRGDECVTRPLRPTARRFARTIDTGTNRNPTGLHVPYSDDCRGAPTDRITERFVGRQTPKLVKINHGIAGPLRLPSKLVGTANKLPEGDPPFEAAAVVVGLDVVLESFRVGDDR